MLINTAGNLTVLLIAENGTRDGANYGCWKPGSLGYRTASGDKGSTTTAGNLTVW